MTNLIIAAGILIVIMLVFIFILFKNIIKRMDENAKKYFVNKMQDYDYILEEKQARLEEIKNEINNIEASNQNILKTSDDEYEEENDYKEKKKKDIDEEYDELPRKKETEDIKYNLNVPNYRETQFFNNYKEVRKVFTVNNEKIIKEFIADHKNLKEEKEYKSLSFLNSSSILKKYGKHNGSPPVRLICPLQLSLFNNSLYCSKIFNNSSYFNSTHL